MSAQKLRTRGWTFTNGCTFEDLIGLIETDFEYLVIGFEVGDSGTPHIQGYIYFKNPRMLKGVRNLMPRAHLLVSRELLFKISNIVAKVEISMNLARSQNKDKE